MSDLKDVLVKVARYPWDTFTVKGNKAYLTTSEGDTFVVQVKGEGRGHTGFLNASQALERCKVGNVKADGTTVTIGQSKVELERGPVVPDGFNFDHAKTIVSGLDVLPEFSTLVAAAAPPSEGLEAFKHVAFENNVVIASDAIRLHGIEYSDTLTESPVYIDATLARVILRLQPEKFAIYPEGVYFGTSQWVALLAHRNINYIDWTRVDKRKGWKHFTVSWDPKFAKWFVKVLSGLRNLSKRPERGPRLRIDFADTGFVVRGWDHAGEYEWVWTLEANLEETGLIGTAWDGQLIAELIAHVIQRNGWFDIWTPEKGGGVPHKFQSKAAGPKPFAIIAPLRV